MGTSYQTLLLVGELARFRTVLPGLGVDGWLVPAGVERTALLPREDEYVADVDGLAQLISAQLGCAVLSNVVHDSDVVFMDVYRDGRLVHEYVSDQAMLEDASGHGPLGADPAVFAAFGVGQVDLGSLGAALRGELDDDARFFAENQHWLILEAMNLEPRALTTAFRWVNPQELPGAVRVRPAGYEATDGVEPGWAAIEVVLFAGLPADADTVAVGQLIADALSGAGWPMRAEVGCMFVIPGAAGGVEHVEILRRLSPVPRIGTYYVRLLVHTGPERPGDDEVVAAAQQAWDRALRERYDLLPHQGPQVLRPRPEQFEIGYRAAARYVASRSPG